MTFSEKFYEHFKIILQHLWKLFRTHYPLKKLPDFDLQDFKNWKKYIFYGFSKILKFHLPLNRLVLTKCWLKYYRSIQNILLMFFIFWIRIIFPKLKKIFDGTEPPQKRPWFKIWKTLKVSFWSICNILVNTWSTLKYFTTNKNWRYRKMTKKCFFVR